MSFIRIIILGAVVTALTGCGFHLRGSQTDEKLASRQLHTVSVMSKEPEIRHEIQNALQNRGFRIVQAAAQYGIQIVEESIEQEGSALESSLTIRTKTLRYELVYTMSVAGSGEATKTRTISVTTDFTDEDRGEIIESAYTAQVHKSSRQNAAQRIADLIAHSVDGDVQ